MNFRLQYALALAIAFAVAMALTLQSPPVVTQQTGYRGLGLDEIRTARSVERQKASVVIPPAQDPAPAGGPLATTEYKNVKVLTNLTVDQFNRLMLSITEWVAPDQGCGYCHAEGEDLSSDKLFTKVVARRMLQMTREVNASWQNHVAATGVTCFTCHRGQPIPPEGVWYASSRPHAANAGNPMGQNEPVAAVGYTALPVDPMLAYLTSIGSTRIVASSPYPGTDPNGIKQTELTYGLMMNMSDALGVNCTFCHNSRSFSAWDQSTPQRTVAYHGLQMVRNLNIHYLMPLQSVWPADRLGPLGDGPKVSCSVCHQGASKPLLGANMLKDNPELAGPAPSR
ncbi:MAG: photosynthetic reaction center cytochrome PufC [Reyranellaceae bacterium]